MVTSSAVASGSSPTIDHPPALPEDVNCPDHATIATGAVTCGDAMGSTHSPGGPALPGSSMAHCGSAPKRTVCYGRGRRN
jgi:hypothetical protein